MLCLYHETEKSKKKNSYQLRYVIITQKKNLRRKRTQDNIGSCLERKHHCFFKPFLHSPPPPSPPTLLPTHTYPPAMEPRAVSVDDAVEAEEAPVHIVGAVKTSVNPGNVEVDWWGLYLWKKDEGPPSAVRVTNANPLTVCSLSEPRTEVATTYDTLVPLWESVEMKAAGTHIELVDREDDHIVVFPVFEDNTVTYTVNGTQRSAFTSLQLRDDDAFHPSLVFVKANMQREVPLPLNFHPIIHPLRRLLDACAVSHNLGKEVVCPKRPFDAYCLQ